MMIAKGGFLSLNKHAVSVMSSVNCQQRGCGAANDGRILPGIQSNRCFIVNRTPDCAWLQSNFGVWAFPQVPIILFSSGCALTDSHYFSLPLEYFKWLLKQETVFSQYDPWPLPHYAQVRNCQANNLGLHLSGRTPILFYFLTNQCKKLECQMQIKWHRERNKWNCYGM